MVLIGVASKLCLKDQLWFTSTLNRKISAEIGQSQCWDRLCQNDSSHGHAAVIAPLTCPYSCKCTGYLNIFKGINSLDLGSSYPTMNKEKKTMIQKRFASVDILRIFDFKLLFYIYLFVHHQL